MPPPFTISIRTILIAGFGGVTAVGIVVALVIGLGTAFHNTQELLTEKVDETVARIVGEIDHRLQPAEAQARWISAQTRKNKLPFRSFDEDKLTFFFNAALAPTPQVAGVAFIGRDGVMHQWLRNGGKIKPQDWSKRKIITQWIKSGETDPPANWGPPIWLDSLQTAVIVRETPLFDTTGYLGYILLAVPIADLSARIAQISQNSFVLVGKTDVLAHPMMINWHPELQPEMERNESIYSGRAALMPLTKLGDPVLEQIWQAEYQDLAMLRKLNKSRAVASDIDGRQYVFLFRSVEGYGPKPWTVGTYIDTKRTGTVVRRIFEAAWIGTGIFVIAIFASLFMARAITRPIHALAKASESVREEKLDEIGEMPTSHIKELGDAISSFDGMIEGLAERKLIRSTLGRYIPKQVAELILKGDGGLAPKEAEATVLFCDVAGFTALTEELGPVRIVDVLNAYFSRMTAIIEAHDGVITQFQGDAILAIFNVPIEADDHAEQACLAALKMRDAVQQETFAGQSLQSRIGINTGPVVAGAVGAEGRLTYTVHGDAVNRAARLEALNKNIGTTILISESTKTRLTGIFPRKIGASAVRGQKNNVTLYTLDDGDQVSGI